MVGHGGSSAGSYLADPTSPIPSHCASIVATSTLRVKLSVSILTHAQQPDNTSFLTNTSTSWIFYHYNAYFPPCRWRHSVELPHTAVWQLNVKSRLKFLSHHAHSFIYHRLFCWSVPIKILKTVDRILPWQNSSQKGNSNINEIISVVPKTLCLYIFPFMNFDDCYLLLSDFIVFLYPQIYLDWWLLLLGSGLHTYYIRCDFLCWN